NVVQCHGHSAGFRNAGRFIPLMTLLAALEDLLLSTPIDKVTVGRLCRQQGVSRSTFYRQFDSLDDALDQLFQSVVTEMVAAGDPWLSGASLSLEPHLRAVYRAYLNHGPLMRAVADAELGELKATSQHYREMMAMWDEAVARRLSDSYPWVDKPELVSHALNAAGERIMYYDFGGGPTQVTDEDFDATVQIMYSMWCSALGIEQGSEKQITQG
ncbi:MAG: TetR/AcrR family transcriptional regulator, partial [Actinomycetota bacterium]